MTPKLQKAAHPYDDEMPAPVKPGTRRQRRRTRQLDELAQSVGYPTWGRLGTAALRGEVVVVKVEPQGERKVAPHRITVTGCDAHTTIIIPLTPAELALVELIADAITRTSSYRCMPTMSVGPAEPDDDDGSAGVVFREELNATSPA